MLEFFPQGLPADPQDPGRLNPIALGEPEHGDDVLSLCLFAHFFKPLLLDRGRQRVQGVRCSSHLGSPRRVLMRRTADCLATAAPP